MRVLLNILIIYFKYTLFIDYYITIITIFSILLSFINIIINLFNQSFILLINYYSFNFIILFIIYIYFSFLYKDQNFSSYFILLNYMYLIEYFNHLINYIFYINCNLFNFIISYLLIYYVTSIIILSILLFYIYNIYFSFLYKGRNFSSLF